MALPPAEERRQVRVELPLEIHGEHWLSRQRQRRSRGRQLPAELLEVHPHETKRAFRVEDREADVRAARRLRANEIELFVGARVMQAVKRAALELLAQFNRRRVNRRG